MTTRSIVWLNGRYVDARKATVSALDRGLLHGDGVYDTWRTYDGEPFELAAHLRRLAEAARVLGLPKPEPASEWRTRTRTLMARNGLRDATIRLTITRGASGTLLLPDQDAPPLRLLTLRSLPGNLVQQQLDGIAVVLLPFPRDVAPWWGRLKLVGHPSAILGRQIARDRGAQEGFYVTPDGEVTEATTANFAIVEKGTLVTPPVDSGVLEGVTRGLVLSLARKIGVPVREERIPVARLRRARECFVTSSSIEIVPVTRIDGRPCGHEVGEVTRRLQEAYRAHVVRRRGRSTPSAARTPRGTSPRSSR